MNLFEVVPGELFSVLASPNRALYADALEVLYAAYLENLKRIAAGCKNADEFKAEVGKQYPQYSGQNYLDMTAGFFFA